MSVGSSEDRVARKEHTCEECRRTIPRGATYRHITGLYDGGWWSAKVCARCHRAWRRAEDRGALVGTDPENGPTFGELAEWLRDFRTQVWVDGQKLKPIDLVRRRRERRRHFERLRAERAAAVVARAAGAP